MKSSDQRVSRDPCKNYSLDSFLNAPQRPCALVPLKKNSPLAWHGSGFALVVGLVQSGSCALVEPHGLSLLRRSSVGYEGRAAVAPLHMLRRAEPSEAYPPSPRLRRVPTSHSSTGLHPWLFAKEGKKCVSGLCRMGLCWGIVASFTHSNPTAKAVICPGKR